LDIISAANELCSEDIQSQKKQQVLQSGYLALTAAGKANITLSHASDIWSYLLVQIRFVTAMSAFCLTTFEFMRFQLILPEG